MRSCGKLFWRGKGRGERGVDCRVTWHGTARHGTARHGTARHGTAQHGYATLRSGPVRHGMAFPQQDILLTDSWLFAVHFECRHVRVLPWQHLSRLRCSFLDELTTTYIVLKITVFYCQIRFCRLLVLVKFVFSSERGGAFYLHFISQFHNHAQ